MDTLEKLLKLGEHYPDLFIVLGCDAFGLVLTLALEWFFLPIATAPRQIQLQKGYTFLFCWFVSSTSSSVLWWAIDPADPLKVRVTLSVIAGAFGFFVYPPIVGWLSAKVPAIGSAWDKLKGDR